MSRINKKEQLAWQVKHGLPNRKEPRGSKHGNTTVAKIADGRVGICASLNCVVSVFVSSPVPVESPVSERRAGRKLKPVGTKTKARRVRRLFKNENERRRIFHVDDRSDC